MKNLKTKISLSALALACLGAGAFSLQSNVNAKAEGEDYAALLNMQAGASICLEDTFSGIRWTTNVTANAGLANAQFGVLVAPTSMVGEDGLTLATEGAENLAFEAGAIDATENDVTFYSVINYDNLGEDLQAASKLELMARAYVTVDGNTYYANMENVSTSRSARAVAMAAELSGYITNNYRKENATAEDVAKATKAANYYGYAGGEEYYKDYTLSTGAVDTPVVDAQAPTEVVGFPLEAALEGTVEQVLIGAEPVDLVLNEADRFRIQNTENAPIGEQYVTVFTSTNVYTFPVIVATKVLKTTNDLTMFRAKGNKNDGSTNKVAGYDAGTWNENQNFNGYYVLGNNIDASKITIDGEETAYLHGSLLEDGSFNNNSWNGAVAYVSTEKLPNDKRQFEGGYAPIGLTGTFNGYGNTITSLTLGSQAEGFFGLVNGGTVKNVAFDNVKSTLEANAFVLAQYLIDATIDNVYIATNEYDKDDATNNPGFAHKANTGLFASYAVGDTKISNSYLRVNKPNGTVAAAKFGAMFGSHHATDANYTCENVVVYVRANAKYSVGTTTTTDEVTKTVYSNTTVNYFFPVATPTVPTVKKDSNSEYTNVTTKGEIYLAENQVTVDPDTGVATPLTTLKISNTAYNIHVVEGVSIYGHGDLTSLAAYDYSSFNTGCWEANSKIGLVWKNL